jgi:hypothetical protein
VRVFRDEEIHVRCEGTLEVRAPLRVPRIMAMLAPGTASDVPRRMEVVGRAEGDEIRLVFEAEDLAQVVMPSEHALEGVTVINEVSGRVAMTGHARGTEVAMEGPGVFEFLRD